MIRPFVIEILLFLAPFLAYAFLLWARSRGVLDPESWPLKTVVGLTIAALVLVAISAVIASQLSGSAPGSTYVPAHLENGRLVPGVNQ